MKKLLNCAGAGLLLGLMASCGGGDKDVSAFAENFAEKAAANQIDSLIQYYPMLEDADSIALSYSPENIKVSKGENGLYEVALNDSVSITVSRGEDGTMKVVSSKGLFAYPAQMVAFANGIGATQPEMNDSVKSIAMNNMDAVISFLMDEYISARNKAIVVNNKPTITKDIQFMMDTGEGYYTLSNTTDKPISGAEYSIVTRYLYMGWGMEDHTTITDKGCDIPANGTYKYKYEFSGRSFPESVKVVMKNPTQEQFFANYEAKGDEFSRFVKDHPDAMTRKEKLADGPYSITGKLDGKYPVHITLAEGMKEGSYYYDKMGSKNTLSLHIERFNSHSGALVMFERDKDGNITGTFRGILTPTNFKGTMETHDGKSYPFDLTVEK